MTGSTSDFGKMRTAAEAIAAPHEPPARASRADAAAAAPLAGVIYNSRSHRNKGLDGDVATHPGVLVARPETRGDLPRVLGEFAAAGVSYLVINGGDGTVRDVLSAGLTVFGDAWPELAVLPKGKTNALNLDLGAPGNWSLAGALDAYATGRRIVRRPLIVAPLHGEGAELAGFVFGAGAFTTGVAAGQAAHRIGAFNGLAIAVATASGVLQGIFGSDANIWRRGVEMRIHAGAERREIGHSGHGDPARRAVVLSSTLENFPYGMKPFGAPRAGLKLAVMDKPLRRVLAMLPVMLLGWQGAWLRRQGIHQVGAEHFEIELGDRFILDGEAFPAGQYLLREGPELTFVVP